MAEPRDIFVLTERDLREVVHLDHTVIDIVEQAFAALASGNVVMPPICFLRSRPPAPMACEMPSPASEISQETSCVPVPDAP